MTGGILTVPALAAIGPSITVNPEVIQTDHQTTVAGTGFLPGSMINVYLYGANGSKDATLAGAGVDNAGNFSVTERIPSTEPVGPHTLTVEYSHWAGPVFTIDGTVSKPIFVNSTGPVGTALHPVITIGDLTTPRKGQTVTLSGFMPGESVTGGYGAGQYGGPTGQSAIADRNGTVTFTYVYPASTATGWTASTGSATFSMNGIGSQSQVNAMATFSVVPNQTTGATPTPAPKPVPAPPAPSRPTAHDPSAVPTAPVAVAVSGRAHFTG